MGPYRTPTPIPQPVSTPQPLTLRERLRKNLLYTIFVAFFGWLLNSLGNIWANEAGHKVVVGLSERLDVLTTVTLVLSLIAWAVLTFIAIIEEEDRK